MTAFDPKTTEPPQSRHVRIMPSEPQTVADHVALARLQVERMNQESGMSGGDLVIATLTRDAVAIEIVRSFA